MELSDFSKHIIIPSPSEIKNKVGTNRLKLIISNTQAKLEEIIESLHTAKHSSISVPISKRYIDIDFIKNILESKGYRITIMELKNESMMVINFF